MVESTPLPVNPPPCVSPLVAKTQEAVNIEVYESVFKKCEEAATRILGDSNNNDTSRQNKVTIACAIFDRFYNDQTAMRAGAVQAKAMIDGMTQILEGRR
jgi:hypothetical protein